MMNPIKVNFKVNFFDNNGKLKEINVMQFLLSNNKPGSDEMKSDVNEHIRMWNCRNPNNLMKLIKIVDFPEIIVSNDLPI